MCVNSSFGAKGIFLNYLKVWNLRMAYCCQLIAHSFKFDWIHEEERVFYLLQVFRDFICWLRYDRRLHDKFHEFKDIDPIILAYSFMNFAFYSSKWTKEILPHYLFFSLDIHGLIEPYFSFNIMANFLLSYISSKLLWKMMKTFNWIVQDSLAWKRLIKASIVCLGVIPSVSYFPFKH